MSMTPYTGETLTIANIGTTPQERAMETSEFKMAFSKDFHEFVEWFNDTHKTDFDAVQTEITSHMAESATEEKLGHVIVDGKTILVDENGVISGATLTNKNLLHNWDFRNPVNQRGQSSYSGAAGSYSIDRWQNTASNEFVTVNTGSVTFGKTSGTGSFIRQIIENPIAYIGKTLTFSIKIIAISGNIRLRFFENGTIVKESDQISTTGIHFVTHTVNEGITELYVAIAATSEAANVTLECAKLELGSVSTLANDPPAVYSEQLAFCGPVVDTIAPTSYIGQDGQWQVY